jgi:hypothetical protein
VYTDFEGREYSATCHGERSEVFDHNIIPEWNEPIKAQWQVEQDLTPEPGLSPRVRVAVERVVHALLGARREGDDKR